MLTQDTLEEAARCGAVTADGHENVDHLTVLIYSPVHVPPDAGDTDVGLVDEPPSTDRVAAGAGRVDQLRCEVVHPPEDGDVIDLDAAFGEEFLDVAVRQAEAQVPAHRQQDHLGWEPVPGEGRPLDYDRPTAAATRSHPGSLTEPAGNCQRNGADRGHGRSVTLRAACNINRPDDLRAAHR